MSDLYQFGFHDFSLTGGASFWATPHTIVGAEFSESPQHHVLPALGELFSVEQRFPHGYGANVTHENRYYATSESNIQAKIESLALDRYVGKFHFIYKPSIARLASESGSAFTQLASITYYGRHGQDIGIGGYAGREVQSFGMGTVSLMNVSGLVVNGHQPIRPHVTLHYAVNNYREGDLYTVVGLNVGVRYSFK